VTESDDDHNRFNGFPQSAKTVKTVLVFIRSHITQLKQGVNESHFARHWTARAPSNELKSKEINPQLTTFASALLANLRSRELPSALAKTSSFNTVGANRNV
jgi:hypothetical protein